MRRHRFGAVAAPLAHHQGGHQPGDAGVDVHDGAAREIEDAHLVEVAAGTPHPMCDRRVDEDRPQADEPQQGGEFHAVGEGAADQRRRDDREGHLEAHVDRFGDRLRQIGDRIDPHAVQHETAHAADERVAIGKGEAVADDHPQDGDQTGHREALHHGRQHVHLADHAAIEQRQPGDGHHQNQCGRGQHPGGVAAVDAVRRSCRRCSRSGTGGARLLAGAATSGPAERAPLCR